jgi:hypothetical protein
MALGEFTNSVRLSAFLTTSSCPRFIRHSWGSTLHCVVSSCKTSMLAIITMLSLISLLLETGIFASQWIWLFRTRRVRKEAELQGTSLHRCLAERDLEKSRGQSDSVATGMHESHNEHNLNTNGGPKSQDTRLNDSMASIGHHKPLEQMPVPPSRVISKSA